MNRPENRHSATRAPAWTTRSRAELIPSAAACASASALTSTRALERRDGGLLLGFKLPAERSAFGALGGAGLRHRVESALGEDNLGGGAFCPSVNPGVEVRHREPTGREEHDH